MPVVDDKPLDSKSSSDKFHKVEKSAGKNAKDAVKGSVILKIIIWWIATVPVALFTSYVITKIIV